MNRDGSIKYDTPEPENPIRKKSPAAVAAILGAAGAGFGRLAGMPYAPSEPTSPHQRGHSKPRINQASPTLTTRKRAKRKMAKASRKRNRR